MKIALIYPAISESGFNAEKKEIVYSHIHGGLSCLSAVCKEEGFNDITLIDLRNLRDWEEFREKVKTLCPDVAGITLMSPDYDYAMKCFEIIKEANPAIKTVAGGMHPTVATDEMAENKNVDYIVVGEGELAFPRLLRQLKEGKAPPHRVIKGERSELDKLPFIDRELFDCLEMPRDFCFPLPFATVLAGRGCSYSCKFCSPAGKIMYGPHVRRRSTDNFMEELKNLREVYGIKSFMIWDDSFAEDAEWIFEFCDKYRKNRFTQPFTCQLRTDVICKNPEMVKALRKAGLVMASIGFESGSDRILKFINKGTTVKQSLEAARICKKFGIKIWAYHMFGLPTETDREALATVRMIKSVKPYRSDCAFFTPRLGSVFYDYCKRNKLTLVSDHDNYLRIPEIDVPKIRNVDYDFMRRMAIISKKPSLEVRLMRKVEKVIFHKKNKPFKRGFEEELKKNPSLNKMTVLRLAHQAGRLQ